jgi:nucleoside-diphosphate-sugar epimerase
MKILLTGGAGDLGLVLAPLLVAQGDTPIVLDPRPPQRAGGARYVAGSILDRDLLDQAVADVDAIVHIAAWHGIHEVRGWKRADEFWDLNVTGTFNVFAAAARAGVDKIVHISSTSVTETTGVSGFTKRLAEAVAGEYARDEAMNVVTLRPRAFIPWWNRETYDNYLEWLQWFWPGAVHIDDVAQAVRLSLGLLARERLAAMPVLTVDGAYDFEPATLAAWDATGPGTSFAATYPEYVELAAAFDLNIAMRPTPLEMAETRRLLDYEPHFSLGDALSELAAHGPGGPAPPA